MEQKALFIQSRSQEDSTYLAVCVQKLKSCDLTENANKMHLGGVCTDLQEGF